MIVLAFFQWWYGAGWAQQVRAISSRVKGLADMFSIGILFRTLFSPWKQIVTHTRSDQAVADKFRAMIDNVISRLVGTFMRSIVLFVAIIAIFITAVFSVLAAIIWPILPSLALFVIPLGFAL